MKFNGFEEIDFDTFKIDGLAARMEAIQSRIQPKFRMIGESLVHELSAMLGNEMFLHIAKHARRTVNPPNDTWLAISPNKRGYKKHPHFQVGLFDDRVFIWLAFIYELPNKSQIANTFIENIKTVKDLVPNDYVVSLDHMKKNSASINELNLSKSLERFRDVKKAELLIGRNISAENPILTNGEKFMDLTKNTFETLLPLYMMSYKEQ